MVIVIASYNCLLGHNHRPFLIKEEIRNRNVQSDFGAAETNSGTANVDQVKPQLHPGSVKKERKKNAENNLEWC